jgi:hypothetical protein
MIEKISGRVAYAVMSFGGFLGMGTEEHAIPWNKLTHDTSLGGYPTVAVRNEIQEPGEQFLLRLVVPASSSKFEMKRHSARARPGAMICEVQVSHDSARGS